MASVTKVVTGNSSVFTVTDSTGAAATLTVVSSPVTGNTILFGGSAVRNDASQMIFNLLNQLQVGLIPASGAQGLLP